MKAAVYDQDTSMGVGVRDVPVPKLDPQPMTLRSILGPYPGKNTGKASYLRRIAFACLDILWFGVLGAIFALLRRYAKWMPKQPFGANPNRKTILVRVRACGVNPVDAKFLYGDKVPLWALPLVKWFVDGRVCGIDMAGIVAEVPHGCTEFKVGDSVFGTICPFQSGAEGAFSEYALAWTDSIALKPETLSFVEAAAVPLTGITVMQAFDDHAPPPWQPSETAESSLSTTRSRRISQHVQHAGTVLVLGASGGTGYMAVQLAKARNLHVTAVCSSKNEAFVKALGADVILAYDQVDVVEVLLAGEKFDMVFDSVTSVDAADTNYQAKLQSVVTGTYVHFGGPVIDWGRAHVWRYLGLDLFPKGTRLFWIRFPGSGGVLSRLAELCDTPDETVSLKVNVSKTFPLTTSGVQAAFAEQMTRRAVGKIVIDLDLSKGDS